MDDFLTIEEAAPILKKPNARAVRSLMRKDPTLPWSKKTGKPLFIRSDLESWLRSGYSDKAAKQLRGEPCVDEASEESGKSASEELDRLLERPTESGQKHSKTSSTPRNGIGSTA